MPPGGFFDLVFHPNPLLLISPLRPEFSGLPFNPSSLEEDVAFLKFPVFIGSNRDSLLKTPNFFFFFWWGFCFVVFFVLGVGVLGQIVPRRTFPALISFFEVSFPVPAPLRD